jgi:hypothetical protein
MSYLRLSNIVIMKIYGLCINDHRRSLVPPWNCAILNGSDFIGRDGLMLLWFWNKSFYDNKIFVKMWWPFQICWLGMIAESKLAPSDVMLPRESVIVMEPVYQIISSSYRWVWVWVWDCFCNSILFRRVLWQTCAEFGHCKIYAVHPTMRWINCDTNCGLMA